MKCQFSGKNKEIGIDISCKLFPSFLIFSFQKKDLTFHTNCLLWDNLYEMSKPIFCEK